MRMRSSLKIHDINYLQSNSMQTLWFLQDRIVINIGYRTKMVVDGYGDGVFHGDPLSEWEYFHIHKI